MSSAQRNWTSATEARSDHYPPTEYTDEADSPLLDPYRARKQPPFIPSRLRLHPLALLPAFLLGSLLSLISPWKLPLPFPTYLVQNSGLGQMVYKTHQNGHLYVNPQVIQHTDSFWGSESSTPPAIRHPILDLIENATVAWHEKLNKQSKTLEEAVGEYRRRYRRPPPQGFDVWFKFAQAHNVRLIDEFDNINRDLEPFWAIPASVINQRAANLQASPTTFTMVIRGGSVEVVGAHKDDGRAKDQMELLEKFVDLKAIQALNITMSAHDGPSVLLDYDYRKLHLDAARDGKLLSGEHLDGFPFKTLWPYYAACPEDSRSRRSAYGLEIDTLPHGPSYIKNHLVTMDMCENPEWQYLHGFTAQKGMPPRLVEPLFSFAKTSVFGDILVTPLEQFRDTETWDPKWEDKKFDKAIWRGSTTGVWHDISTWWRQSQRVRLWSLAHNNHTLSRDVRFQEKVDLETETGPIYEASISVDKLIQRYIDMEFTKRVQCDEDGSCDEIKQLFTPAPAMGWNEANEYKYQLDLDGNAWSGRFHRQLQSNSAVLKSTIFPEWYSDWIQPWVHYIPIKVDYTDLFDIMTFFSGNLEGDYNHDELARQIGQNGKDYVENHWRYIDMVAYVFRLSLEWARLTSDNREVMSYRI